MTINDIYPETQRVCWCACLCVSLNHGKTPTFMSPERKAAHPNIYFQFACISIAPRLCVHVCLFVWMDVSAGRTEQHHTRVRQGSAHFDRQTDEGGQGEKSLNRTQPEKVISDFSVCVFLKGNNEL